MASNEQQVLSEPIVRGPLHDLDVGSLLSALRLGRQYLTLEVYDAAGDCTGVVAVKAGHIVSASVDGYTGTEAVQRLLQRRDATDFRVLLQPIAADTALEPLGTIAAMTSETAARTRVMEGTLDEQLSLSDVLRGLAFTRQHVTLVLSAAEGQVLGEVAVKANKVLSARAGDLVALPALRQLQRAPLGSRFVVFTETQNVAQLHPLGTVAEVLSRASEPAVEAKLSTSEGTKPISVMEGDLADLDVASLLQVAGVSRQYTSVQIFDDQRSSVGVIHLKGGHVVRAQAQDVTGVVAVRRLLHCPRDFSFLVQRYPEAPEVASSLGSIADVLTRATASAARSNGASIAPPHAGRSARGDVLSSTWIGGAVLGAGFVLLGGIATALMLRPTAQQTSISAISTPPHLLAPAEVVPRPALREAAPVEPEVEQPVGVAAPSEDDSTTPVASDGTPSRATIASLQAGLQQLGYETGPIDGVMGPRTTAAIKAFQYAEHLTADGTLSGPTRAVLMRRISEP